MRPSDLDAEDEYNPTMRLDVPTIDAPPRVETVAADRPGQVDDIDDSSGDVTKHVVAPDADDTDLGRRLPNMLTSDQDQTVAFEVRKVRAPRASIAENRTPNIDPQPTVAIQERPSKVAVEPARPASALDESINSPPHAERTDSGFDDVPVSPRSMDSTDAAFDDDEPTGYLDNPTGNVMKGKLPSGDAVDPKEVMASGDADAPKDAVASSDAAADSEETGDGALHAHGVLSDKLADLPTGNVLDEDLPTGNVLDADLPTGLPFEREDSSPDETEGLRSNEINVDSQLEGFVAAGAENNAESTASEGSAKVPAEATKIGSLLDFPIDANAIRKKAQADLRKPAKEVDTGSRPATALGSLLDAPIPAVSKPRTTASQPAEPARPGTAARVAAEAPRSRPDSLGIRVGPAPGSDRIPPAQTPMPFQSMSRPDVPIERPRHDTPPPSDPGRTPDVEARESSRPRSDTPPPPKRVSSDPPKPKRRATPKRSDTPPPRDDTPPPRNDTPPPAVPATRDDTPPPAQSRGPAHDDEPPVDRGAVTATFFGPVQTRRKPQKKNLGLGNAVDSTEAEPDGAERSHTAPAVVARKKKSSAGLWVVAFVLSVIAAGVLAAVVYFRSGQS